jgi:hypothetical protein
MFSIFTSIARDIYKIETLYAREKLIFKIQAKAVKSIPGSITLLSDLESPSHYRRSLYFEMLHYFLFHFLRGLKINRAPLSLDTGETGWTFPHGKEATDMPFLQHL